MEEIGSHGGISRDLTELAESSMAVDETGSWELGRAGVVGAYNRRGEAWFWDRVRRHTGLWPYASSSCG